MTFKITFQNRILLGRKVVRLESRCRIRALEIRGQRRLFPPGDRRGPPKASAGCEGGAGITTRLRGSGTAPAPIRRGPHRGEPPASLRAPGASRRGTRPPRRAAGARRSLPRPLNLPGDSDAGAPPNPAGRSRSQLRLSPDCRDPPEQRPSLYPGTASGSGELSLLRSSGSGATTQACQARRGSPLPRSRRPRVGSGSGGDLTRPEAMRGADGARGLGGTGRGGDEGGPCGARNRQLGVRALPGHYNNGGPIKARAPGVARRAPRRRRRR